MNNKNLEIKFGGDLHKLDVDLLIESLINYSSVTQETAAYLSPGIKVDIKIKAPRQGSFIILLDLIAQNAGDLFTANNIALSAEIVTIVGGLYGLKKWITKNGKPEIIKPIEGDNIEISSKKGRITISNNVYNIYQENPKVKEKQELSVFKIVFKENYKWEFFYSGSKIYASLKDKSFFKKIEKGEAAFRSGDRLIVVLEIEQIFNEAANTFVNEKYNILKVIEHIPRVSSIQHTLDIEK